MRLTQFGLYSLPLASKQDQFDTGSLAGNQVVLIDGQGYDHYGADVTPEAPTTYTVSYEIIAATPTAVQTERDAIRALAGTRARLWASLPDGSTRWTWARLARVRMARQAEHVYYQPVTLTFDVLRPGWAGTGRGANWFLDSGTLLDSGAHLLPAEGWNVWVPTSSPLTMTAANSGNRTVRDAVLTVTAGATTISNLRLVCGSCDWTYGGTVAANKTLVIDCASRAVTNDGANDYKQFTLNAGHVVADWLRLAPGNNTVTLTYSGNASNSARFTLSYSDGWI